MDDASYRKTITEAGVMESDALRCNVFLIEGRHHDASGQEGTEMETIVVTFLEEWPLPSAQTVPTRWHPDHKKPIE